MMSRQWVKRNIKKPVAILNTHGYFDHVWSNADIQEELIIHLFIQKYHSFLI